VSAACLCGISALLDDDGVYLRDMEERMFNPFFFFFLFFFFFFMAPSNNMLYPEENHSQRSLIYVCKYCDHTEPAKNSRVFYNKIITSPE